MTGHGYMVSSTRPGSRGQPRDTESLKAVAPQTSESIHPRDSEQPQKTKGGNGMSHAALHCSEGLEDRFVPTSWLLLKARLGAAFFFFSMRCFSFMTCNSCCLKRAKVSAAALLVLGERYMGVSKNRGPV